MFSAVNNFKMFCRNTFRTACRVLSPCAEVTLNPSPQPVESSGRNLSVKVDELFLYQFCLSILKTAMQ